MKGNEIWGYETERGDRDREGRQRQRGETETERGRAGSVSWIARGEGAVCAAGVML
jgi:hypothetical protein